MSDSSNPIDSDGKTIEKHWFAARKPFWWALAATVLISSAGALAISFIHSTTPTSTSPIVISGKELAKAKAALATNSLDSKGAAVVVVSPPSVGESTTQSGRIKPAPTSVTNASIGTSAATSTGGGQTIGKGNTGPASVAVNSPTISTGIAPLNPPLNSGESSNGSATLQWSKGEKNHRAVSEKSKPIAGNSVNESDGSGSFPPKPVVPAKPTANGAAAPTKPLPSPSTASSSASSSSSASPSSPAPQAQATIDSQSNPAALAASSRLRSAQDGQCANSNFFSRIVCDERVRLRFCRDRWNDHQDCTIQNSPRDL